MEKGEYQKLPSGDDVKYISAPPAYSGEEDVERLITREEELASEDGCTPGRLCLASTLAAFCCFWPAAVVGMVASIRARYAANARARKMLRVGKIFVIISVVVGVVAMLVLAIAQFAIFAHVMKGAYKGGMRGYVDGLDKGYEQGRSDASALLSNGVVAKFPEHIPGSPNVFDVNSQFWADMQRMESPKETGILVGYSFGWVDGYKKGFCGVENTDCTGVSLVSVADYVVKCEHMKAKMEKAMRKHHEKKMKHEHEEEESDDDDEQEHKMMHHHKMHMGKQDQQQEIQENQAV